MRNPQASRVSSAAATLGRASLLSASLLLGACAQMGDIGLGSGVSKDDLAVNDRPANELEKATDYWAKEAAKNPRDDKAVLNHARNLKAAGRKQEALSALQNGYLFGSNNKEYLSEYGRLALDMGQTGTAAKLLEQADDPGKPDWRVISARGTALAKQGDYKGAITFFERARDLAPSQASLMNNLAMAYTMDGQAEKAEQLLRQAEAAGSTDPRVKQNLALVLGLQGKHQEARAMKGETGGDEPTNDVPVGISSDGDPAPARAVASTARPKPQPIAAKGGAPVPAGAKPMDPDEVIRAAIDADMRSKKPATPIMTSATPRKKAATQTGAPITPTIINADATPPAAEPKPVLRPTR